MIIGENQFCLMMDELSELSELWSDVESGE